MPSTTTTNMGLIVPTVGQEPGPDWANDINADMGILDQHNHSSGQGVPITPSGINISSDLPFNDNNATTLKTIRFQAQSGPLSGVAPNLGCVYVAGNELYYNDVAGNVVKITSNGSVNAGSGSISGLPSGTASASYSGGTFIWQSATNTPANTDTGSVVLRNNAANSKGLTLGPPNSMATDIAQSLPSIPSATSFMQMDTSGNMSAAVNLSGGIITSMIANGAVTAAKIASGVLPGTLTPTVITSSQNYTVPAGVNYLYVIACGGGGGGGGGNSATTIGNVVGGGGGAGAVVWEGIIPVTGGSTYAVTIGAGGAAGPAGNVGNNSVSGGAGGSTSFGSLLVAPGGAGGTAPPSWNTSTVGTGGTGRGRAGDRGGNGSVGAGGGGGTTYLLDLYDGTAGSGGASNGTTTGGGGGGGGGSIGAGGNGGNGHGGMGAGTSGGGGGGGGGGLNPFKADDGAAGGSGYMAIYII